MIHLKQHIPNTLTCCNLLSGAYAVHVAFGATGHPRAYTVALAAIIVGAAFDFLDGMVARLLGVSSPIGKELDSLADVVTFGLAPSAMLFSLLSGMPCPQWLAPLATGLPYVAFLMAAFSALRLAKFNVDPRQSYGFIGLPTPANALFWGSLVVGGHDALLTLPGGIVCLIVVELVFCVLLVAEVPMFALKFKSLGWKGNEVRYVFLLGCLPCLLVGRACLALIVVWYLLLSLILLPLSGRR